MPNRRTAENTPHRTRAGPSAPVKNTGTQAACRHTKGRLFTQLGRLAKRGRARRKNNVERMNRYLGGDDPPALRAGGGRAVGGKKEQPCLPPAPGLALTRARRTRAVRRGGPPTPAARPPPAAARN